MLPFPKQCGRFASADNTFLIWFGDAGPSVSTNQTPPRKPGDRPTRGITYLTGTFPYGPPPILPISVDVVPIKIKGQARVKSRRAPRCYPGVSGLSESKEQEGSHRDDTCQLKCQQVRFD